MRLRVARSATADLDEIWAYVAKTASVETAEWLVNEIASRFRLLAKNPSAGRRRPDLRNRDAKLSCGELSDLLSLPNSRYRAHPSHSAWSARRRKTLPKSS